MRRWTMCDEGEARQKDRAARLVIREICKTLLLHIHVIKACPNYGRIVYRSTPQNGLDVQFSTKLEKPES